MTKVILKGCKAVLSSKGSISMLITCLIFKINNWHIFKSSLWVWGHHNSRKYLVMCKIHTDVGGIKKVIQYLPTCTLDNPLAKARGLSPRIGGQAMV